MYSQGNSHMSSLQYLLDKHAIEQIYIRYCELIDRKQFDDLTDVFSADSVGEYTAYNNVTHGVGEMIAALHFNLGAGSNCGPTHHNVGNFRIAVDGDRATSKVHYYAVHRGIGSAEGALYSMWGQYTDTLQRSAAGWRVTHRQYDIFLTEGNTQVVSRGA
jgi:3-phenylpropionate/cinnamic acid dioxygenase small subunit